MTEQDLVDIWDKVDMNFDGDDEMAKFCSRQEIDSALYQVETVAILSPRGKEVPCAPRVHCRMNDEFTAVSVNQSLSLFGSRCKKLLMTFTFESDITSIEFTESGAFLIVAESFGKLHFIDVLLQISFYSHSLDTVIEDVTFADSYAGGVCDMLVLSGEGNIWIFANFQASALHQALCDQNIDAIIKIKSALKVGKFNTGTPYDPVCLMQYYNHDHSDGLIVAGTGGYDREGSPLCLLRHADNYEVYTRFEWNWGFGARIVKCQLTTADRPMMVALDDDNHLSLWDLQSMLVLYIYKDLHLRDFVLVESGEAKLSRFGMKLVGLTIPNDGVSHIRVLSLHDMNVIFTLQVSQYTYLAKCPAFQNELVIIEATNGCADGDTVTELRIRCITEVDPDTKLHRLLRREKFDRAEKFAQEYQLDLQVVYISKANYLLLRACDYKDGAVDETLIKNLFYCLKLVQNTSVLLDKCTKTPLPTYKLTYKLLTYLKNRVTESRSLVDEEQKKILAIVLYRLHTFRMGFGEQYYSPYTWDKFSTCDFISTVQKSLMHGQLKAAFIVWNRHIAYSAMGISESAVMKILESIPSSTRSNFLSTWLEKDFIPVLARYCPAVLIHVAQWMETKSLSLEHSESDHWPQNGLRFAQILPDVVMRLDTHTGQSMCILPAEFTNHTSGSNCPAFVRLNSLINNLRKLLEFHTKYEYSLTLQDFLKETTESLAFRLLDKARTPTAVRVVIKQQLDAYIQQYKLDRDRILYLHIMNFAKQMSCDHSNLWWEAVAVTVIDQIAGMQYKCKAVVVVMKNSCVPWSQTIQRLVDNALHFQHPHLSFVMAQYNFCRLCQALIEYGLKDIAPEQLEKEMLIRHIIHKNKPSSVKDALTVVDLVDDLKPWSVHSVRLNFLVEYDRLSDCLVKFCGLPKKEMKECGLKFIDGVSHRLEAAIVFDVKAEKLQRLRMTEAAVAMINILLPEVKGDIMLYIQLQKDEKVFSSLAALQREFGEFVTPRAYTQATMRAEVMYTYLKLYYIRQSLLQNKLSSEGGRKTNPDTGDKKCTSIYRLADLLLVTREEVRCRVAIETAKMDNVEIAIRLSKEVALCNMSPASAEILYQVTHVLHGFLGKASVTNLRFANAILTMINHAACCCSNDLLVDCLELQKCVRMTARMGRRVYYNVAAKTEERHDGFNVDPYTHWSFFPCYMEETYLIDATEAMAQISKFQEICLPVAGDRRFPYLQYRMGGQSRLVLEHGGSVLDGFPEIKSCKHTSPTSKDSTASKRSTRVPKYTQSLHPTSSKSTRSLARTRSTANQSTTPSMASPPGTPTPISADITAGDTLKERVESETCEPTTPIKSEVTKIRQFTETCNKALIETNLSHMVAEVALRCMVLISQHVIVQNMDFHMHQSIKHICDHEEKILISWRNHWTTQFNEIIFASIDKLLIHRFIDKTMLLCCLDALPPPKLLPIISKCVKNPGHSYKKLVDLCEVGLESSRQKNVLDSTKQLEELRLKSHWGHKLCKYKIAFKYVFQNVPNAKEDIVLQLVRLASSTIIREYFTAFKLNRERIFPDVMESLLLSDGGCKDMDAFPHCQRTRLIMRNISEPKILEVKLWKVLDKLSIYDYKRIGFVLNELSNVSPGPNVAKGLRLISFLGSYKRVSPPGEYELTLLGENEFQEDQMMCSGRFPSGISRKRLPFHVLYSGQPLKVIKNELIFETVGEWVALSSDLKLAADHLYMLTIQNCVTQHIANQSAVMMQTCAGLPNDVEMDGPSAHDMSTRVAKWKLDNVDVEFYDNVCELLKKISDCAQAVVCASWVVKELPAGAEKVHALEWCVKMTELWVVACPDDIPDKDKARRTHAKFSTYSKKASTEQILYENDIAEVETLALLSNPAKLIFELYHHPTIVDRYDNPAGVYPDIHRITSRIAVIHRLDIKEMQLHLTNQWLFDQTASEIDLSLTFNFEIGDDQDSVRDDTNQKRLLYLLGNVDTETTLKFLINSAFTDVGSCSKITPVSQLRCLHCALFLADTTFIEQVTGKKFVEIRIRMSTIQYIIELEKLMIKMTCRSFGEVDKEQLSKMIWNHHKREKRAVMLVSVLCIEYAIYDPILWTGIIHQLIAQNLVEHLEMVLLRISYVARLYHVEGLEKAWQLVIMTQLHDLSKPVSEQDWNRAMKPLYLYIRCPVIDGLNMDEIINFYEWLELLPCAIHLSLVHGRSCADMLENVNLVKLLGLVKDMNLDSEMPDATLNVIYYLYSYVRERKCYDRILGSRYVIDFATYLIERNDIYDLMRSIMESQRIEEAEELACLYNMVEKNHQLTVLTPRHQLEDFLEKQK